MSGPPKASKSSPAVPSRAPTESEAAPARHPRWKWGIGILGGGLLLELITWFGLSPDQTMQVFFGSALLGVIAVALLVWWLSFSGLTWSTRRRGLLIVAVVLCCFTGVLRFDSYSGSVIPRLTFRWTPTREQIAEKYWSQNSLTPAQSPENPITTASAVTRNDSPEDWPEFRGRLRDGVVRHGSLRSADGKLPDWEKHPPVQRWRHPLGAGIGSFAIVGNSAVTLEQRKDDEAVVCYDFDSGRELWAHRYPAKFVYEVAGEGPRSTPTIVGERVYTLGATGQLCCLELTSGKQIWAHDTVRETGAVNPIYGTSVSPLIYENLVIVNPGGPENQAVVAYNAESGVRVWSSGRDRAAYVSPQIATLDGVRQILIYDGIGQKGLQPQAGSELWHFDWSNTPKIHCSQPLVIDDRHLLISSGYGRGSVLLKIEQTPTGWQCDEVWKSRDLKMKFNPGVLHAGHVYGIDEGILACVDVKTGKRRWKEGRYGYGQTLLVEDLLLIQAESGEVAVVEASPEAYREVTRFPALKDKTWNIPVLCRGRLLVRNESEAACYDLANSSTTPSPAFQNPNSVPKEERTPARENLSEK